MAGWGPDQSLGILGHLIEPIIAEGHLVDNTSRSHRRGRGKWLSPACPGQSAYRRPVPLSASSVLLQDMSLIKLDLSFTLMSDRLLVCY